MRQIVLDTETTGLDPARGHRIIEIGCVELYERRRTGREFQRYFNPQRDLDAGAQEVTGLSTEFLADKPLFRSVVDEFLAFVDGAELIIHNAAFDISFLNAELALLGREYESIELRCRILDTLAMARSLYPGQKNSLDALCRRLQVDSSHRRLHGALLDAHLLTHVYLAMTAGQGNLGLDIADPEHKKPDAEREIYTGRVHVQYADTTENILHLARLEAIHQASKNQCMWFLHQSKHA